MEDIDLVSAETVDAAIRINRELGPGLLESVYETVLAASLARSGLKVARQVPIDINYDGMRFEAAFRIDMLVDDQLVVEIKSLAQIAPVHAKQLITCLRLMKQPVGLLLNFGGETMKEGIRRLVNHYQSPPSSSASPRLRAKSEYGA